jgi:hypothetical protein
MEIGGENFPFEVKLGKLINEISKRKIPVVNPEQIFCEILFYLNSLMINDFSKLMILSEIF